MSQSTPAPSGCVAARRATVSMVPALAIAQCSGVTSIQSRLQALDSLCPLLSASSQLGGGTHRQIWAAVPAERSLMLASATANIEYPLRDV
mmetsp:Transcript_54209/g.100174  ORF Transcript_54209/g.100174 Transcript_54209/m.100174 type:complete len:91 (+) Transcript_54209:387-659(+)